MAKSILSDKVKQREILDKIDLTGKEKGCWEGICSESTFYDFKKSNSEFSEAVAKAKDNFRKTLWRERPDLKKLAVEALEKNLIPFEQVWEKTYYKIVDDGNGEFRRIPTKVEVTKVIRPPAKWAIENVLDMKNDFPDEGKENWTTKIVIEGLDYNAIK